MKRPNLLFLLMLLVWACSYDDTKVGIAKSTKFFSEEYFTYDATAFLTDGFVPLYKRTLLYDHDRLVEVDIQDYNIAKGIYEVPYLYQQYHYTNDGKLNQKVEFVGTSGLRWVEDYEYPSSTSTKVTRYATNDSKGVKVLEDWWIMDRAASSLTVSYYQGNNELYAQLIYNIGVNGNVISAERTPSFPNGKIYYKYDNAPNPYKFVELSGEYGVDSEKYLSENNVVEMTNDSDTLSTRDIEYNAQGYPSTITTSTSKIVFTYR